VNPEAFGVYVHVPFCARRCDYCDFATWTDRDHLMGEYVDACVADLARRASEQRPPATSVFFGGGTPSLLPADELVRVLDAIDRADDAEVTVECNPDAVDDEKLATYARAGVNRLSFGVQSMVGPVLRALGRTHDPENVGRAVRMARAAGFARINLDLIYGSPAESPDDWRVSLEGALALEPEHISAYALTIEPGTPLGQAVAAGRQAAPDDDRQADAYLVAEATLGAAGFEWYEVSNWAQPGEACRHNELYWSEGSYLGIGCAAHGHTDGRRWWNVRTPERYIAALREGTTTEAASEMLAPERLAEERFVLALRTRRGAEVADPALELAQELAAQGLLELDGTRAVLTAPGRLLASDLTARLLLAGGAIAEGWGADRRTSAGGHDPEGAGGRTQGVGTRYH
jgi:putative oxygen-independent coproporphyrinogen III oxidase